MAEKQVDAKQVMARMLLPAMMTGTDVNKVLGVITAFKINSDRLVLYKSSQAVGSNSGTTIMEGKGIIDISTVAHYIKKYPRVNIINKGTEDSPQRIFYMLKIEDTQLIDKSKEKGTLGTQFIISAEMLYIDEGPMCKADPRKDEDKLLSSSYASLDSYIAMQLILNGYQEGVYKSDSKILLGKKNDKLVKIPIDSDIKMETKKVELSSKLKVTFYKYGKTQTTCRYRVPRLKDMEINKILMSNLERRSGIIILDNLMASDLINSKSFQELKDYKNILFIGDEISSKSEYVMVDADASVKKDSLQLIKKTKYDFIIDDDNKLDYEDILELAENSLVIISENTTNIDSFIKKFDILNNKSFENFIDKTLYIGSIYTQYGLELTNSSRRLLKLKDLRLFSEITSIETIENVVKYIFSNKKTEEVDEVLIKPMETYVTSSISMRKINYGFFQSDIVYTLWRLEKKLNVDLLSSIEEKGYCIAISSVSYMENNKEVKLALKYLFFGDRTKIHLKVSPISMKDVILPKETIESVKAGFNVVIANPGEGKTNLVKNISNTLPVRKRVFVFDKEYDIVESELKSIEVYINRSTLDKNFLKHFSPEVIILNSEISDEEMKDIFSVINRNQLILMVITGSSLANKLKSSKVLSDFLLTDEGASNGILKSVIQPKLIQIDKNIVCKVTTTVIKENDILI